MRGYVLDFDGLPHPAAPAEVLGFGNLNLGDTFEIEFKLRYLGTGAGQQTILDKGPGAYRVRLNGTVLQLARSDGLVLLESAPGRIRRHRWHNVIVWKNAGDGGLLIDQVDATATENASAAVLGNNSGPMAIGCTVGLTEWFKGQLKDLRFWETPRSSTDRIRYAYRPLIPEMANLRAWWPIFEGSGDVTDNVAV